MNAPSGQAPDGASNSQQVQRWLQSLQSELCGLFEQQEPEQRFQIDQWQRAEGGGGDSRVLNDGVTFERAGVNFSSILGDQLPPAATKARPELTGRRYKAMGVSVVVHPRNPHVPTAHMNVRYFEALADNDLDDAIWWFGGGFDLTPYYGYRDDARHWHQTAYDAVAPFDQELYAQMKTACDRYFYLPHRDEPRGIGGLFFDDLNEPGFDSSFTITQSIGESFSKAYLPIVEKRKLQNYGDREREFQLYRRGRYVEFNLVHDRGTLFGLQSGGRTESILMSMPPLVRWEYRYEPEAGSEEARLYDEFLKPQDWLIAEP